MKEDEKSAWVMVDGGGVLGEAAEEQISPIPLRLSALR